MKSMTGYGSADVQTEHYHVTAEIRAWNHRFLEISVRLPREYRSLEERIREMFSGRVFRGKLDVSLTIQAEGEQNAVVSINHEKVCAYLHAMMEENRCLAEEFGSSSEDGFLPQDLTLSALLRIPELFQTQYAETDLDAVWNITKPVLSEALEQFCAMRMSEGLQLQADLSAHLASVADMVRCVENQSPETVRLYREKLSRKMAELLKDTSVDEARLLTEAAIFAEKIAVDEETVRLYSHISQFQTLLESSEPIGRKMDFLVQEMNREVNTIGSKSQSLEIARLVVAMKSEIEKIREQVQNVE